MSLIFFLPSVKSLHLGSQKFAMYNKPQYFFFFSLWKWNAAENKLNVKRFQVARIVLKKWSNKIDRFKIRSENSIVSQQSWEYCKQASNIMGNKKKNKNEQTKMPGRLFELLSRTLLSCCQTVVTYSFLCICSKTSCRGCNPKTGSQFFLVLKPCNTGCAVLPLFAHGSIQRAWLWAEPVLMNQWI